MEVQVQGKLAHVCCNKTRPADARPCHLCMVLGSVPGFAWDGQNHAQNGIHCGSVRAAQENGRCSR